MKCVSGIRPAPYEVRRDGEETLVILTENITEQTSGSGEEQYTEYTFDRYDMKVPYRDTLENDIANNTEEWLSKCKQYEYDKLCTEVRAKRNELLAESDSSFCIDRILPDNISTSAFTNKLKELAKSEMARYRQALRDIPQQEGFPYEVIFPAKPQ